MEKEETKAQTHKNQDKSKGDKDESQKDLNAEKTKGFTEDLDFKRFLGCGG